MKFNKSEGGGGDWVDKKTLQNGDQAKLVTEALPLTKDFQGKSVTQIVAKIRIKGDDGESKNFAINPATKNALIDAFGEDSKAWCGKILTMYVEESRFAGKKGIAAYLIPEGYDHWDDENGYLVIGRKDADSAPKNDINPDDIPF